MTKKQLIKLKELKFDIQQALLDDSDDVDIKNRMMHGLLFDALQFINSVLDEE